MKLSYITNNLPHKILLTTTVAAGLALASCNNPKQENDKFEGVRIEAVENKSLQPPNVIEKVIQYDTDRLKPIKERGKKSDDIPANIPARILAGGLFALLGGIFTAIKGKGAKNGAVAGGILGSILPGISISALLTTAAFRLFSIVGGAASKFDEKVAYSIGGIAAAITATLLFLL